MNLSPETALLLRAALLFVLVLLIERYGRRRQARRNKHDPTCNRPYLVDKKTKLSHRRYL